MGSVVTFSSWTGVSGTALTDIPHLAACHRQRGPGTSISASSTTPLAVTSAFAANVRSG